ncbi:MAG: hypothetical protein JW814_05890 [Candidatus Krumholzibacteriota bacterium]|nr:hypothetical protein [Candidatus Krumholzibacteriota bacterium]
MRKSFFVIKLFVAILLIVSHGPVIGEVFLDEEEVVFRVRATGATRVFLVGDFNEWNPTVDRMIATDGLFEIRLFLVTGKYRYMFIVDGESIDDPVSPVYDEEGRAFFIFREFADQFEIVFSDLGGENERRISGALQYSFEGYLFANEERQGSFFSLPIYQCGDKNIEAQIEPGFEFDWEEPERIDSYFLRASASFRTERGMIGAFNRSASLDYGDPLSLFSVSGPFDYSAGLFTRGVEAEGKGPFGFDGRIFYASRIVGYDQLEKPGSISLPVSPEDLDEIQYLRRSSLDSDIFSFRIGSAMRGLSCDYLFRYDIGPSGRFWQDPDDQYALFTGYEKMRIDGFLAGYVISDWIDIEAEYLSGVTDLVSQYRTDLDGTGQIQYLDSRRWEEGKRIYLGISFHREKFATDLSWSSSELSGDPMLRGGRRRDERNRYAADLRLKAGAYDLALGARSESFSENSSAEYFWLEKWNFWLDGDDLSVRRLPFLESRNIIETFFSLSESAGDSMMVGYQTRGLLSVNFSADPDRNDRRVTEFVIRKGLSLDRNFSIHFDARHIIYDDQRIDRRDNFTDIWGALCWRGGKGGWIAVGTGVSPLYFDRWRYSLSHYGRERAIADRGVFRTESYETDIMLLEDLYRAERAISGNWNITIEAGLVF